MERRGTRSRFGRALAAGALVFSLGLGVGVVAGGIPDHAPVPSRSDGPPNLRQDAPRSVPATDEQRAEVPLYFVAFHTGAKRSELLGDGEPWML